MQRPVERPPVPTAIAAARPPPLSIAPLRHRVALAVVLSIVIAAGLAVLIAIPEVRGIYLFGLYAIPSNSLLPIPHEPGLLYFAQFHQPIWLALAGSLGAGAAAFTDYFFIARALRIPRIARARNTRAYRWAVRWLMRRPFATVMTFAALPLPITVVRILAPAHGYPLRRYVPAMMLGRLPRFFAVAWLGHALAIPAWLAVALFAGVIALALTASWLRNRQA